MLEIRDARGRLLDSVTRLVDVSASGLQFRSTLALARNERLRGRLRLLREGVLDITGHVIWVEKDANATLYGIALDSAAAVK